MLEPRRRYGDFSIERGIFLKPFEMETLSREKNRKIIFSPGF